MLLLPSILAACLLTRTTFATLTGGDESGWHGISNFEARSYNGHEMNDIHQDLSSYDSYSLPYGDGGGNGDDFHGGIGNGLHHSEYSENVQNTFAHAVPISEHVEVTKPVAVPVIKNIGVPVVQPVAIPVPHPVAVAVPQPYPVHVPVPQPVAVPVVKTIAVPVEKKVPYPVEKIIPVPVEKAIPITVEKYIPVPVEKPYPIHIPVYKHVFHRKVKNHGHGWSHRGWVH